MAAAATVAWSQTTPFGELGVVLGKASGGKFMLDPLPRVVLVPGLGLFGLGRSAKDARIAADLAETAIETITVSE